jgi:hypothetical protein
VINIDGGAPQSRFGGEPAERGGEYEGVKFLSFCGLLVGRWGYMEMK